MHNKLFLLEVNEPKKAFQSSVPKTPEQKYTPLESTKKNKFFSNKMVDNNNKKEEPKEVIINSILKEEDNNNIDIPIKGSNIIQINNLNSDYENDENERQFNIGRWTLEEHKNFIDGILKYGNEWKKVQQIIKTRSSTQARSHAQKFFLRIKKTIKLEGGNSIDKQKLLSIIKKNVLPNKEIKLTEREEEKLLIAISSNIKYEGENSENNDNEDEYGPNDGEKLEKISAKLKELNTNYLSNNTANNTFTRKFSVGQKRKPSKNYDKIFSISKDPSRKSSMEFNHIKEQYINEIKNNINDTNKFNINNNNEINQDNYKLFDLNKKFDLASINSWNNNYNDKDNYDNKNNNNGRVITNIIHVTNNYSNNTFYCNLPNNNNNDIVNNNNLNYKLNNINYNSQDYNLNNNNNNINYMYDKNEINFNPYNQNKHILSNPYLYYKINNNINNYNDLENSNNNQNDPFRLEFGYNLDKNCNSGNERQITINEEDEYFKTSNNNEDNTFFNF